MVRLLMITMYFWPICSMLLQCVVLVEHFSIEKKENKRGGCTRHISNTLRRYVRFAWRCYVFPI